MSRQFFAGTFNVDKCVGYLRSVGVEISDETALSWADSERVTRYLRRLRRRATEGADMWCPKGHAWYGEFDRGRRCKSRDAANDRAATCPTCGVRASVWQLRWSEARDGTFKDYRDRDDRWKPRDAPHPLAPPPGIDDGGLELLP